MKRKLRKSLSWLLTVAMIFSLFCGMIPTASAAGFYSQIYQNDDKGISVELERSYAATDPRQVTFTVIVDNETVLSDRIVSGVPTDNVTLKIAADGYDITFPTTNGCTITSSGSHWLLDLHSIVANEFSVTINLASEKGQDDIQIANDGNSYGTFHWLKSNAGNTAFTRELTVYVNGTETYTQTINTPKDLTNGGTNNQYWFTPNIEIYNADCEINPPISLDQVVNRNVAVYLTTKCDCGLSTCLCSGGCNCPPNCGCTNCMGEGLADNQLNTGYGVVTYNSSDDGYELTIKVYVNGEEKYTSEQIKVQNNRSGNLKFAPKEGYYYQINNGYDLDAAYSDAWWNAQTGDIYFGIDDKSYDSVLKIYLWTFENQVALDVERVAGIGDDDVSGYILSYDAFDPEANANKTYTFTVTNFEAAQIPYFPAGTDVTIKAICRDGYEVTKWTSTETRAELSGTDHNTVQLRLNETSVPRILVYINSVGPVARPTDDELKDLLNQQIKL